MAVVVSLVHPGGWYLPTHLDEDIEHSQRREVTSHVVYFYSPHGVVTAIILEELPAEPESSPFSRQ